MVVISLRPQVSKAQEFQPGDMVLHVGLGIGSIYGIASQSYSGNAYFLPAFHGSLEKGLRELGPGVLGVGGSLSYQAGGYHYVGGYNAGYGALVLAARGAYHPDFMEGKNYDVYGALQLGIRYYHYYDQFFDHMYGNTSYDYNNFYPFASIVVGGRYYFSSNIGVFAELGYDVCYLKAGIALKL